MKYWLWTGHVWRQVSVVEAKFRFDAGALVVEAETSPVDAPAVTIEGGGPPAAFGNLPELETPTVVQTAEPIETVAETVVEMPGVASADVAESIAALEQAAASRPLDAVEQAFVETQLVDASQTLRLEFKDSKNVTTAVLDTTTGIVTVTFVNGKSYRFANFTAELMAEWNAAESAGKWFNANVRKSDLHPPVEAA